MFTDMVDAASGEEGISRDGGEAKAFPGELGSPACFVVVVVTPNFFTVGGEGAQEGDEEGKAEK